MVLHDTLKNAKIAEDLFVYFLEKGFQKVSVSIDNKLSETVFTITLFEKNDPLLQTFQKQMYCNRDLTIEEYGWEVMIENDSEFELDHLGYQLDSYLVSDTQDGYTIEFTRKSK